jgi:hypothetical protein
MMQMSVSDVFPTTEALAFEMGMASGRYIDRQTCSKSAISPSFVEMFIELERSVGVTALLDALTGELVENFDDKKRRDSSYLPKVCEPY